MSDTTAAQHQVIQQLNRKRLTIRNVEFIGRIMCVDVYSGDRYVGCVGIGPCGGVDRPSTRCSGYIGQRAWFRMMMSA